MPPDIFGDKSYESEGKNPVLNEPSFDDCICSTAFEMIPEADNYRYFWNVCPENIVDLPDAESFKAAVERLRLPKVVCGQVYECVIKLFNYNNSFADRIQLLSFSIVDDPGFVIETNPKNSVIYIKGIAKTQGELKLRLEYRTVDPQSPMGTADCELIKVIPILPEDLLLLKEEFQNILSSGNFSPAPAMGFVGEPYESVLDISEDIALFHNKITLTSCDVIPRKEMSASISGGGILTITGVPAEVGPMSLILHYDLELSGGIQQDSVEIPFTDIAPDRVLAKWDQAAGELSRISPIKTMTGENISIELQLPACFDLDTMAVENVRISDEAFSVICDTANKKIELSGTPQTPGTIQMTLSVLILAPSAGNVSKTIQFPVMIVTPDPRTLWKELPTDPSAPYQSPDEEHVIIHGGNRTIVAASKRGRSHAHDGKFRDDNFQVDYIEKTGWFIISVSDGAGSAKFSRAGSRIACETFREIMHEKLSSDTVNEKINSMESSARETALKNTLLNAAYQGLSRIDAEAKQTACSISDTTRKDYNATFLGYVMKQFADKWLIVSIGIGDGIMGLLDWKDDLILLSEPDGGEFAGQTCFITMNNVWQENPVSRTRSVNVSDFGVIMAMTDGISDPKFETDNNLKNRQLWLDLWNDIIDQVPLMDRSEETALKLSQWLDFWAKGNHDDRTIVLVY